MKELIKGRTARQLAAEAHEWLRIHGRRVAHIIHMGVAGSLMSGPVSYLCLASILGVAMTLTALYTPSYAVYVNGQELGVVTDQAVVERAVQQVEQEGSSILGYPYQIDSKIDYAFGLSLKSQISETSAVKTYFYQQLDSVCSNLRMYQVVVDGEPVGVVQDKQALETMLESLKEQYRTEQTVSAEFVDTVTIENVYTVDNLLTVEEMQTALSQNKTGNTTYTVEKGDTFNGIAYANDMSVNDLMALNPDVNIDRLMIGDVLNVKELVPRLSVRTVNNETYSEEISCPVEEVEDNTLYVGSSKILVQGQPGEAQVSATVTYINGYEQERIINSTQTLRESTTTKKAVGTKEKPKTASSGKYQWPITGRINSYFGGRYIFGSYSYHSGIDIRASYGAAIKAADGGTVTFAGIKGTYGKLVVITHDNGTQTYYGHNSSLLVKAGAKVYKGQQIAKAGSTGRSTGVHCHFEIRVNGKAVNPLSYLP